MKAKYLFKNWAGFAAYAVISCLVSALVTGSIWAGAAVLVGTGAIGVFEAKKSRALIEKEQKEENVRRFLLAFFKAYGLAKDPRVAYQCSSSCLEELGPVPSFEDVRGNQEAFINLPLGPYRASLIKALGGKEVKWEEICTALKKEPEGQGEKLVAGIEAVMGEATIFFLVFLLVKVTFGKDLIDYKSVPFTVIFCLLSLAAPILGLGVIWIRMGQNEKN
jgi:hypothetical protein